MSESVSLPSFPAYKILAGALLAYALSAYIRALRSPLHRIPTVGSSDPILSWWGAINEIFKSKEIMREGYKKHFGRCFKIPTTSRWIVVVTSPQLIEDLRKASDDKLSFHEATAQTLQTPYTFGKEIYANSYHVRSLQSPMNSALAQRFPEVQDEIATALSDLVPATNNEWFAVPMLDTVLEIISRSSNRLFVGLPICRNPRYVKLNIEFTLDVTKMALLLTAMPEPFRPFVAKLIRTTEKRRDEAAELLGDLTKERLEKEDTLGPNYTNRPADLFSWLLDYVPAHLRNVRSLTTRILTISFAAIHTTSTAATHAFFDLAAYPEYIEPLRQEIIEVVEKEGWTRASLEKMYKLDSFVKESQRCAGITSANMSRLAMKDFTFSDGTFIPKGTLVVAPVWEVHHCEATYENPFEFRGFRFVDMARKDGSEGSARHQSVVPSLDWMVFGVGRHTCPGRFFAVVEIKALLAHAILNYDIKLEGATRPKNMYIGIGILPSRKGRLLFRKRESTGVSLVPV